MNDHALASSSIAATEPIGSTGLHRNAGRPFQRLSHGLESDIAIAVGERGWRRLAPAIRRRFANTTECYGTHHYTGVMSTVVRSKMGWLLAQICRLIGTPLAPHAGRDVPVTVTVYPDADGRGIAWDRTYHFTGRAPVTVRSSKILNARHEMSECVGGGFGMDLDVFERDRALHFVSKHHFWRVGRWRIRLPQLLSPGTAHVVHTDEGGGFFRFTITMTHPVLGTLFFQDGLFTEVGE